MKKLFKLKRFISSLLAVTIIVSSFWGMTLQTHASESSAPTTNSSSQNLISSYLNMMKSSTISNIETVQAMQNGDLRVISLFLSNFLIPFASSLDGEKRDENIENMIPILQSIGFDKDAANQVISKSYDLSLSTATELYMKLPAGMDVDHGLRLNESTETFGINKSTLTNEKYVQYVGDTDFTDSGDIYTPATLFLFWTAESLTSRVEESYVLDKYEFYRKEGGSYVKVFEVNRDFTVLFASLIKDMDFSDGKVGNSLINTTLPVEEELNLSDSKFASLFIATQKLYVDWVGNIICDYGDRRIVVVPALMNPMTFSVVRGAESLSGTATEPLNMYTSVFGLNRLNQGSLEGKEFKAISYAKVKELTRNTGSTNKYDQIMWFKSDRGKRDLWEMAEEAGINKKIGGKTPSSFVLGAFTGLPALKEEMESLIKDSAANIYIGAELEPTEDPFRSSFDYYFYYDETAVTSSSNPLLGFKTTHLLTLENKGMYFMGSTTLSGGTDTESKALYSPKGSDSTVLPYLFLTYLVAYVNSSEMTASVDKVAIEKSGEKFYLAFNSQNFPQAIQGSIEWTTTDITTDEVLSFVYYLLHPSKGVEYFARLIKNKLSGLIVSWHEDIVGNTSTNTTTGATKYVGFTGYTTIPNLYDIEWLAGVLSYFDVIVVYLIILMCIVLLCYIIVGQLSVTKALTNLIIFSFLAFLPPVAISSVINVINVTSDSIYSRKFDYWAMTQGETYIPYLVGDGTADSATGMLISQSSGSKDNKSGYASSQAVKVKWGTPKRVKELAGLRDALNSLTSASGLSNSASILTNMFNSQSETESFVDDASVTYLYRDYLDIYKYGAVTYNIYNPQGYNFGGISTNDAATNMISGTDRVSKVWSETNGYTQSFFTTSGVQTAKLVMANMPNSSYTTEEAYLGTSSLDAIARGFLVSTVYTKNPEGYYVTSTLAPSLFLRFGSDSLSRIAYDTENIKSAYTNGLNINYRTIKDLGASSTKTSYGIPTENFDYSINSFIADASAVVPVSIESSKMRKNLSTLYYSLYSESPYYYFNYNTRDQLSALTTYKYNKLAIQQASVTTGAIKDLFLQNNQDYFFNLTNNAGDGYGELRDFMNMHDFFYYILPVLQQGVDNVNTFDDLFGMYLYDDSSLGYDSGGNILYDGVSFDDMQAVGKYMESKKCNEEEIYKVWHDYNVYSLYNTYTTWLATMNDCNYADKETIVVAGEKFVVKNPLDPTSYFTVDDNGVMNAGRYMVFSRSEMAYYGLTMSELTQVEQKIIKTQDAVYKESLNLMNYFTLSNETLIHAYSFIQLFEFNKQFSQKSLVSSNLTLYPQGYELKAFTLDAYLRLIVAESSGEAIMQDSYDGYNESIYMRVLQNTSVFFGFVLLINDFICMYALPIIRFVFILIIFLVSLCMIIAAAIKLNEDSSNSLIASCWKSLISPLLSFGIVSVGLAFVVSLFMSNGAQGVTQTSTSISLGDPTMVLLLLIAINIAAIILYWKITSKCFKDLVFYLKAIGQSVLGNVAGALQKLGFIAMTGKRQRGSRFTMGTSYNGSAASDSSVRGKENNPRAGKAGIGSALGGTAAGLGVYNTKKELEQNAQNGSRTQDFRPSTSKYNQKASSSSDVTAPTRSSYEAAKQRAFEKGAEARAKAESSPVPMRTRMKAEARSNKAKLQATKGLASSTKDLYKKGHIIQGTKQAIRTGKSGLGYAKGMVRQGAFTAGSKVERVGARAGKAVMNTKAVQAGVKAGKSVKRGYGSVVSKARSYVAEGRTLSERGRIISESTTRRGQACAASIIRGRVESAGRRAENAEMSAFKDLKRENIQAIRERRVKKELRGLFPERSFT